MATITARINMVILNRGADLFFEGENVFVPFGTCAAKDLASRLDSAGADTIKFEYHTISDPKEQAKDAKKFGKRLATLGDGWEVGEWTNKVIRGFVFDNIMVCIVTRKEG